MALLRNQKVVIPQIQRDYAQGRTNEDVSRIRERFLNKLCEVLDENYAGAPLKLDFIYGYSTKDVSDTGESHSIFKPLDGQQRLTTLFLLHWYVAVQENKLGDYKELFSNFSYATRAKSRKFCEELVRFLPAVDNKDLIKKQIEDQPWFFLTWTSDPTISSMLVMLEAIEKKFKEMNLQNVWQKLTGGNPSIVFYLLNMDDLGLPEDLYIKMNSRGKPLTQFEHFKAQFSRIIPAEFRSTFNTNIDKDWSDLFWDIYKNEPDDGNDLALRVDNAFLNFYNFITDYLISTHNLSIKNSYWLDIAGAVYSRGENVAFLFKCLNTFVDQQKNKPTYFEQFLYVRKDEFSPRKVRIFFSNATTNLFHKCAKVYRQGEGNNPFSIGEQLLLYACMKNLQEEIVDFHKSLRKIRNFIASSVDQMRKEYLGILFTDVDNILYSKPLNENNRFSKHQIKEEKAKADLLSNHPGKLEVICRIEDHDLLRGTISILGIDASISENASHFEEMFSESSCDYNVISLDLMRYGNYSQGYGGGKRRVGNGNASTWRELFTLSDKRSGFENTRNILLRSFSKKPPAEIVMDWRYYFGKYDSFRSWEGNSTYGYYHWKDFDNKPFECFMMFKEQFNGRHWNPFLLEIKHQNSNYSLEPYGNNLQVRFGQVLFVVSMSNSAYHFSTIENDTDSEGLLQECIEKQIVSTEGTLPIPQINDHVDSSDRIALCLSVLNAIEDLIVKKEIV